MIEDFKRRLEFIHRMSVEFATAVPDDKWEFTPALTGPSDPERHGEGFAPFCKQLRHVVGVRGVYADSIATKKADFGKKHAHYTGDLSRASLLAGLDRANQAMLTSLDRADIAAPIDFFGRAFTFADLTYTIVQHEAIHHGQWSVYALLGGFKTPRSWRVEWGL